MKTADEILDDELSENMIEYLEKNQIFREWIKDAMYNYAQQCIEQLKIKVQDAINK